MRHNVSGRKLGRKTGHRLAMFRNQLASLVEQERIVTTISKAKELRPLAERIVTQGKRDTVHARRLVGKWVVNRELIKKLFDEIAPRFASRPGGYLRIVKLGSRQGDNAEMAVLEFVDFKLKAKSAPPAPEEPKGKKASKDAAPEEAAGDEPKKAKSAKTAKRPPAAKAKPAEKQAGTKSKAKASTKSPASKRTSAPKKIGSS